MSHWAKLIAKCIFGLRIIRSYKTEIDGKQETINIISNKGSLVTIPCEPWGEIFISANVLNKYTNPELNSALFHEIYHKYHQKIKWNSS